MLTVIISAVLSFLADRISKVLFLKEVFGLAEPVTDKFGESVPLIDGVFHLTYTGNTGMAFGMLAGNKALLITLCVVILAVIVFLLFRYKPKSNLVKISVGMIVGGALGNVLDRIVYGFVIDFLDFCLIDYPVFNVADCSIVIGAVLFCVYIIFFDKKEDKVESK